jgi:hypothetical protein
MTHRPISTYTRPADRTFWTAHAKIRTHARGVPHEVCHEIVGRHFVRRLRRFLMFSDYQEVDAGRAPR